MSSGPVSAHGQVAGPPLKAVDRLLRRWRAAKIRRFVPRSARVLDIGCYDGALFEQLGDRVAFGVGIDPLLTEPVDTARCRLIPGRFPGDGPGSDSFDVITLLAVLEHIPESELVGFARDCLRFLKPGGIVVLTVPSESVDRLLHWLSRAHLVAGMSAHEHHGLKPSQVPGVFAAPAVALVEASRFQLGLNNLFVFRKSRGDTDSSG